MYGRQRLRVASKITLAGVYDIDGSPPVANSRSRKRYLLADEGDDRAV